MTIKKKQRFIIILILASAYNSIYSLAFMKGLYYTLMQTGLGLTHFRLGQLYSVYGFFAMFSYLCGAFFLNRFARWKLISGSSLIVGILTMYLVSIPSYVVILFIFGIIGFLIGATFYPAHLEILHLLGGSTDQGSVFGLFFVMNSVLGVIFASIGFAVSSLPFSNEQRIQGLLILFAILNFLAAIFSIAYLRHIPSGLGTRTPLSFHLLGELIKNTRLWLVIFIVFANYVTYSNMNYMLPYLSNTFHLPQNVNNILSIVRVYFIGIIAAPIAGKITDRLHSASRLLGYAFSLYSFSILVMLAFFRQNALCAIISILFICLFSNMGKSMALVTIDEAHIPPGLYGVAISFISFCAYSPDAFYYSFSGWILDISPAYGYHCIFLIAALFSLAGSIAVRKLGRCT